MFIVGPHVIDLDVLMILGDIQVISYLTAHYPGNQSNLYVFC